MDINPFQTLRDEGSDVVGELRAAGFGGAEEIGSGGFGVVYRCRQVGLDRWVAVKVLIAELDGNRERFVREQQAMGRLTGHPHIVGVLQVGETVSGYPFLVMQYHRRGSLEARVRELGPLSVQEVLGLGVKLAGALGAAHRIAIVHRDVKPGNVLLTDFGEPALCDFGIARMSGGFKTATGIFTGSPAFTAPEVLGGVAPGPASDVYGLGATLFCALTGHAAFERRSGEQVVAQFVRIATCSAPDLRESGIDDDVAALIDAAMSRDAGDRPSAFQFAEAVQRVQSDHGFAVDEVALRALPGDDVEHPVSRAAASGAPRRVAGNLPLELTSFVGRRTEVTEVTGALLVSRLVTLTGVGGVGKTRLALRAAAQVRDDFGDGVWLAELAEVREGSLLVDVVAAALGLRDVAGRAKQQVLADFLAARELLLVLDNCEQVIDDAAKLAESLLRVCPRLRILATSREALAIGAELVVPLSPLGCPDTDDPTLRGLPGYDAVALFTERAAAAVHGFALTAANKACVARICARLDGLPLAIELAAARLKVLSPEQIVDGLTDRYALLTRGARGAPARQQNLSWSVGWSYDLCCAAEQQLWGRLSVFPGTFDLDAAHDICGEGLDRNTLLDLLSSLVDKSILIRSESGGPVRFRFLETLRDYGRTQIVDAGEYPGLRRRHADWVRQMVHDAEAQWISPHQVNWIHRLKRELPNIREALEFTLSDDPHIALAIAAPMGTVWYCHGLVGEGRRWYARVLADAPREPSPERVKALKFASFLAAFNGDVPTAVGLASELEALVENLADPVAHAHADIANGYAAMSGGDMSRACTLLENAVDVCGDLTSQVHALLELAWAHELRGDEVQALATNERALALTQAHGESLYRTYALWALGIATWSQGDRPSGAALLYQALGLAQELQDPIMAGLCIEALAWIAGEAGQPQRAVTMLAAADTLGNAALRFISQFPNLLGHQAECESRARVELDVRDYDLARQQGSSMDFSEAIAYTLAQ